MKAKEYLNQLENLDTIIRNKLIEKAQWRDIALGVTSGGESVLVEANGKKELHNMEKVQSSGRPSKMADAIDRCVDMEKEIDKLVEHLIDLKTEIIKTIEQLPPIEYDVIHKRYIQNMTFDEIGTSRGGRSKSWATTVHGRALHHLQWILDNREAEKVRKRREMIQKAFKDKEM